MSSADSANFLGSMPVGRLLARIAIPGSVALIVNSTYNLVDTIFVGQGVGPLGIAAVTLLFPLRIVIMSFGNLVGIGAASIVSRALGAGERERATAAAGTALTVATAIGLFVGVAGSVFAPTLVRVLGGTGELFGPTYEYTRIIVLSEPFLVFNFSANFLIRAEGRARAAMVVIATGMIINIILDPIFIFGLGWGVGGAALATLLGHAFSTGAAVMWFIRGRSSIPLARTHLVPRWRVLRESLAIGFSGFVRQFSSGVVQVMRNQLLVSSAGALAVSAVGITFRTILVLALPAMGIAQALPPIAGYNFGAGNPDRVRRAVWLSMGASSLIMWVGFTVIQLIPATIFAAFTTDAQLVETGIPFMRVNAFALLVFPTYFIGTAFYQAIGKPIRALAVAVSRPLFSLVLMIVGVRTLGPIGVVGADPAAIALGAIGVVLFLLHSFRTDPRLSPSTETPHAPLRRRRRWTHP